MSKLSRFNLTKNWILSSGLAVTDPKDENLGGVHSSFDEKRNEYGFLYPEITGYFTSALRFLYSVDTLQEYITLAKNSADWLVNIEKKYGGIIQGVNKNNSGERLVYSFDTGVCATGILDCYQLTQEEKYLKFAQKLLGWISDDALKEDGTLHPVKDLNTGEFFEEEKYWYKQPGCLHIKVAIPFLKMYKITKNESALITAKKILEKYNTYKNNDGSLSLHTDNSVIHIHSLCYALEGLMYGYHVTHNEKYLENIESALRWCVSKIEEDGGIQLWFNSSNSAAKTSYHVAQLARLMILFNKAKEEKIFQKPIELLLKFMFSLQNMNGVEKAKGGFYEEYYKEIFRWKKRYRVNSWGSMFALQAMYLKENYDDITFGDSVNHLF